MRDGVHINETGPPKPQAALVELRTTCNLVVVLCSVYGVSKITWDVLLLLILEYC
jgi:hypothetical protein